MTPGADIDALAAARAGVTVCRSGHRSACRSGHRSARPAALLAREGLEWINLAGGMRAWARAGLPAAASGGRPGQGV